MDKPPLGAGSLKAFLRQGAKEVAQVLPAFKDGVQVVEEQGTCGNPTPRDVDRPKRPQKGMDMDDR
jgi:hypothetical protein